MTDDIFAEYKKYIDRDGLVQIDINPGVDSSDNGMLWTTEAYLAIQKNGQMTPEIKVALTRGILSCEDPKYPGLFHRSKDKRNQEGPDDYAALVCFCAVSGNTSIAKRVLAYGRKRYKLSEIDLSGQLSTIKRAQKYLGWVTVHYNYNDENPGLITGGSWLGRFPAIIAALKYTAGYSPNLFEFIYFIASLIFSATRPKEDHDAKILSWLLIHAVRGHNIFIDIAIRYWFRKLLAMHPGGMREVFTQYFQNTVYPTSKYSKN